MCVLKCLKSAEIFINPLLSSFPIAHQPASQLKLTKIQKKSIDHNSGVFVINIWGLLQRVSVQRGHLHLIYIYIYTRGSFKSNWDF